MYTRRLIVSRIVFHVGPHKTGTSSIQQWLAQNPVALREHGYTALRARHGVDDGEILLEPHKKGGLNSGWIVGNVWASEAAVAERWAETFAAQLSACAERYGNVILSGETFSVLICTLNAAVLSSLQRLAGRFEIEVAYYARPQHSQLEAEWRESGFRRAPRPAPWIEARAARFHFLATLRGVRALAPDLKFEPRPFRRDLLHSGSVVIDFMRHFLGIETEAAEWANLGLPLEVVNVLAAAPEGMFWDKSYGNARIGKIKRLVADQPVPEDDRVALSRQVLRKYAHERYADENTALGWEDLVPPPDGRDEVPGLDALDELWTPQASPSELAFLLRALDATV
jgi:hypothetical protein